MKWQVGAEGKFYRELPEGFTFSLLEVEFRRFGAPPGIRVQTVVDSGEAQGAIPLGRDNFERAAGAVQIVLNASLDLGDATDVSQIAPDGRGTQLVNVPARVIVMQEAIGKAASGKASAASEHFRLLGPAEARRFGFALRWYDRNLRASDPSDRLVLAWIGFETATDTPKGTAVNNAIDALMPIYPKATRAEIEAVVRPIYSARNAIFHNAELDFPDIAKQATRCGLLLADVLERKLGVGDSQRATVAGFL